ncbi:MAG: hypothetical protein RR447_04650, partial [Algoriella sp.]
SDLLLTIFDCCIKIFHKLNTISCRYKSLFLLDNFKLWLKQKLLFSVKTAVHRPLNGWDNAKVVENGTPL